jgi:hypothetical protein
MLQVFYVDVVKVDCDVAYVAMVVHVCCKLLFPMFQLFSQMYVASVFIWIIAYVLHICCKCFVLMLCMFYKVFKCFLDAFTSVSFKCMFQVFQLP